MADKRPLIISGGVVRELSADQLYSPLGVNIPAGQTYKVGGTALDAAGVGALSSGDLTVTKQGNTFNGAGQLVQLDSSAPTPKLPAVDGSQLLNVGGGASDSNRSTGWTSTTVAPSQRAVEQALSTLGVGQTLITKTSHGFVSPGDLHKILTVGFTEARADTDADTIGMLVEVVDVDTLRVLQAGVLTWTGHGMTVGAVYFVDATGGVTPTSPTGAGQFSKPVFRVLDANTIELMDYPAVAIGLDSGYQPTPPASNAGVGAVGQWAYSSGVLYFCVNGNTWVAVESATVFP